MNRTETLNDLIDIKHKLFTPSNKWLYTYATMTDKELKQELEHQKILERIKQ